MKIVFVCWCGCCWFDVVVCFCVFVIVVVVCLVVFGMIVIVVMGVGWYEWIFGFGCIIMI